MLTPRVRKPWRCWLKFRHNVPFLNSKLDVRFTLQPDTDIRLGLSLEPLFYRHPDGRLFCAPEQTLSDGVSDPPLAQFRVERYGAAYWAARIHDAAYQGVLLQLGPSNHWVGAQLDKDGRDTLLLDAMAEIGCYTPLIRQAIYEAVKLEGTAAWMGDIASAMPKIIVPTAWPT